MIDIFYSFLALKSLTLNFYFFRLYMKSTAFSLTKRWYMHFLFLISYIFYLYFILIEPTLSNCTLTLLFCLSMRLSRFCQKFLWNVVIWQMFAFRHTNLLYISLNSKLSICYIYWIFRKSYSLAKFSIPRNGKKILWLWFLIIPSLASLCTNM